MDTPMEDVQDLEERIEQEVNTERESSENINLRQSMRIQKPPK